MNRYYTLIGICTLIDIYSYLLNAMSAYANANIFTQTYKNSRVSFSSFLFLPAEIPAFILSSRPSRVYHLSTISSVDLTAQT